MTKRADESLCWILTTRDERHYWHGPGLRPLDGDTMLTLCRAVIRRKHPPPYWASKREASAAARALARVVKVTLQPLAVRLC